MSASSVTVYEDGFEFDDNYGQPHAYVSASDPNAIFVATGDYVDGSNGILMSPEDTIRFGFYLAGLGAKALRAQR